MRHLLIKGTFEERVEGNEGVTFCGSLGRAGSMPGTGDLNGKPTEETRLFIK